MHQDVESVLIKTEQPQHPQQTTPIPDYVCIFHSRHLLQFFSTQFLVLKYIKPITTQHQHLQQPKPILQYALQYNSMPMLLLPLQKDRILLSKLLMLPKHLNQPLLLPGLLSVWLLLSIQMPLLFCKTSLILFNTISIYTFYSARVWTNYGRILFETTASARSSEKLANLPKASAALC